MHSGLISWAQTHPVFAILTCLAGMNLLTILAFWYDKRQATRAGLRLPERRLLLLALFGGTPAAFWARQRFRHKTRKQPFSTYLMVIAAMQVAALATYVWRALNG